ncbi:MAG: hypothetical protein ACP5NL_01910 [Thermoplasmata archaeon]
MSKKLKSLNMSAGRHIKKTHYFCGGENNALFRANKNFADN